MRRDRNADKHTRETFQKVMKGVNRRDVSDSERRAGKEREAFLKKEAERIQADARAAALASERAQREELAHQRAEAERRKLKDTH